MIGNLHFTLRLHFQGKKEKSDRKHAFVLWKKSLIPKSYSGPFQGSQMTFFANIIKT